MRMRQVSILAALLAVGCAHGKSETKTAKAGDEAAEERAEKRAERREESAEQGQRAAADEVERVKMPEPSDAERGRLANAGGELPAEQQGNAAPQSAAPQSAAAYGTPPDNTRVNERDRESSALTPLDQKENETDLKITQRIRKAVVADDSLSFTAKNVKIITRDGQVTLRGSVKKAEEKTAIEKVARDVAGPGKVVNELEIAK